MRKMLTLCSKTWKMLIILWMLLGIIGSADFCGFGIDSSGFLYIGRKHHIEVYDKDEQIKVLQIPVRRGWAMTVSSNDHILIADGSNIHTMELDGTVIGYEEDTLSRFYRTFDKQRVFVDNTGNNYCLKYKWICPTIQKNGKTIYRAPLIDVAHNILSFLFLTVVPVGMIYEYYSKMKEDRKKGTEVCLRNLTAYHPTPVGDAGGDHQREDMSS